jgi:hypothetical protein
MDEGMSKVRSVLNDLHKRLAIEGYSEVYIDMITDQVCLTVELISFFVSHAADCRCASFFV